MKFGGSTFTAQADTDGLRGAHGIVFTDDGMTLYASASDGMAVSWFTRNPETGGLEYLGLIKDGDFSQDNLAQPKSVAISPDNKTVYAGGFLSHNILWFNRDSVTGSLSYSGSLARTKDNLVDLASVRNIALSDDGKNIYATASDRNAVHWFNRKTQDGSLGYGGKFTKEESGLEEMENPRPVVVTADGKFVYIGNHTGSSVLCFARNPGTGALTLASSIRDSLNGVDGLEGVQDIKLSSDNKFLYVAGYLDNSISWFTRSSETGELTFVNIIRIPIPVMEDNPLFGASALEISQDGKLLFAGSYRGHGLSWFHRDTVTGDLTLGGYSLDGLMGVEGIRGVEYILLSPDEKQLYVSSGQSSSLAWFEYPDSSVLKTGENKYIRSNGNHPIDLSIRQTAGKLFLRIKSSQTPLINIRLINIRGKTVFQSAHSGSPLIDMEVDKKELVRGILSLQIRSGSQVLISRLVLLL